MTAKPPLAGITVLDFGQIYQGPYATMLMAKAGANVIKIEPLVGEPLRRRAPDGQSLPIAMLNANKRAITLNLKSEKGRALLIRMAKQADVLLENFAPGVMDRLGVGWDVLHAANPKLIYATGTGYGITGSDRDNQAMDLTIQAVSGIMSVTGMPDGPPMKAGPTRVDFMGGIHLYAGIMTALFERTATGTGRLVEVAMQETVYCSMASSMESYYRTGNVPKRTGNHQAALTSAPYNVYEANDGHVAINVVTEEHWQNLLGAMGREDLRGDARYETMQDRAAHMAEIDAIVTAWTRTLGKMEIFAAASRARIPAAPVRNVAEIMSDPHMHGRGMLEHIDHPQLGRVVLPNSPLRLHGAAKVAPTPSPKVGADNLSIYGDWLGLSAGEISEMRAEGVI